MIDLPGLEKVENPSQYSKALNEGFEIDSLLKVFPIYYYKKTECNFCYVSSDEVHFDHKNQYLNAIVSLSKNVMKLPLWRINQSVQACIGF